MSTNFAITMAPLSSGVEGYMDSFFKLETAVINACQELRLLDQLQTLRSHFAFIRSSMKKNLELINETLRGTIQFGDLTESLQMSLSSEDHSESETTGFILRRMVDLSHKVLEMLQNAVKCHSKITEQFRGRLCTPAIKEILRKDLSISTKAAKRAPATTHNESASKSTTAPAAGNRAWIEANLASIHPDGLKALEDANSALSTVSESLAQLLNSWNLVSSECSRSPINTASVTIIARQWRQENMKDVISNTMAQIDKSSDAMIPAVGAYPPAEDQNEETGPQTRTTGPRVFEILWGGTSGNTSGGSSIQQTRRDSQSRQNETGRTRLLIEGVKPGLGSDGMQSDPLVSRVSERLNLNKGLPALPRESDGLSCPGGSDSEAHNPINVPKHTRNILKKRRR